MTYTLSIKCAVCKGKVTMYLRLDGGWEASGFGKKYVCKDCLERRLKEIGWKPKPRRLTAAQRNAHRDAFGTYP